MLTWRRVLLIGCCAVSLVRAQTSAPGADQNDDETVYDIGPGVTPPRVIKQVNPRYSTRSATA